MQQSPLYIINYMLYKTTAYLAHETNTKNTRARTKLDAKPTTDRERKQMRRARNRERERAISRAPQIKPKHDRAGQCTSDNWTELSWAELKHQKGDYIVNLCDLKITFYDRFKSTLSLPMTPPSPSPSLSADSGDQVVNNSWVKSDTRRMYNQRARERERERESARECDQQRTGADCYVK